MVEGQPRFTHIPDAPKLDASIPHSARFWNYLVGGKDNFESDRRAAMEVCAALPVLADLAKDGREFLIRAVRFLAGEGRIRQYLDVGTGVPTANNTHEVAQAIAPDSRIVYVDNDPIVLVHARSLLTSTAEGVTDYIDADVHDPERIVREAAQTLDFSQPVGVMLMGIINFVLDDARARDIVAALMAAVPSGSYLAVQHPASEDPGMVECIRRWNQHGKDHLVARSREEVGRYFDGLQLLEPGVVTLNEWRPDDPSMAGKYVPSYAAVGVKP